MMLKRCLIQPAAVLVFQLLVGMVAVGVPIVLWSSAASNGPGNVHNQELRLLRTEKTNLSQAIEILRDHEELISNDNASADSLESLALSIMEEVQLQASGNELQIDHLVVMPNEATDESTNLHALRIDIEVRMSHTMHLLGVLDAIKLIADWRPMEIRRCSILRMSSESIESHASCAIDVYYYPGIDL